MDNLENINENEKIESAELPIITVNYDVKNEEEGQAFLLFQKRFVYKKNWIKTAAFAVVAVLFLISIIRYPDRPMNYMLFAVCLAAIFVIWHNTRKIRTSLMEALKMLEDDKYLFTLYDDKFRIETIETETTDENGEEIPPIPPRVVKFSDITLHVFETEDKFVLVLKKDTIYVLPKRCMNNDQIEILRNKFKEKLSEDFEKIN